MSTHAKLSLVLGASLLLGLTGCAAISTSVEHRDLDVQTKMSKTIFLPPRESAQKTVYVQVKNTSDKQNFRITPELTKEISSRGYRVVNHPEQAHYLFQANILQVGKADPHAIRRALDSGFGAGLTGAAVGAAATGAMGGNGKAVLGVGLVGGLIGTVANAMVKDIKYSVITDVMVSERKPDQSWERYQTRVVSTADKVNLDFAEAAPALEKDLTHSLANIL